MFLWFNFNSFLYLIVIFKCCNETLNQVGFYPSVNLSYFVQSGGDFGARVGAGSVH